MENRNKKIRKIYSFDYYVLLFFLVSFFGWIWEVCIYLVREKQFVNRGIMAGPWLPVYGAGALFLYFLLHRWRKKPLLVFFASLGVCSLLEYVTGYFLLKMWGVRWWDYSGMFLDLNGHICFASCLMFGGGGVFLMSVLLPVYTAAYEKIPEKIRLMAAVVFLALFVMDAAYSADFPNAGRGITYEEGDGSMSVSS